jgi:hypothetical protein
MTFDILIVQYRSESTEPRCLETLSKFTKNRFKLMLYDNNSGTRTLTSIWDDFIRQSQSEFIVLANPDVFFGPDWDDKCLQAMRRDPMVAACTPAATGEVVSKQQRAPLQPPEIITDNWLIQSALRQATTEKGKFIVDPRINAYVYVIRKSAYIELGGFDAVTFPFYWQETELNFRFSRAGYKVGCVRDAYVHHVGRVSTRNAEKEGLNTSRIYAAGVAALKRRYPDWARIGEKTRVLVTIPHLVRGDASRLKMLDSIIREYRSFPYDTDIFVVSDRKIGVHGATMFPVTDMNTPMKLPYLTRKLLSDKIDQYDLFIYAEDDIRITKQAVAAFLHGNSILGRREVCGLFRYEVDKTAKRYYTDAHGGWKWDPQSIKRVGNFLFAKFANLHQGCFLLTNEQMRIVLRNNFTTDPHREGAYGFLECAATDPYLQCGLTKYMCVSHFSDFLIQHLSGNYTNREGWWGGAHSTEANMFEAESRGLLRGFNSRTFRKDSGVSLADQLGTYY